MLKECLLCGIPHSNDNSFCFKCDDKHLTLYNKELFGKDFDKIVSKPNKTIEVVFDINIEKIHLRR